MQRHDYSVFRAIDLILRSLLGKASEEEEREYRHMAEDTGLLKQIEWLTNRQELRRALQKDSVFDEQEAYRLFRQRIRRTTPRPVKAWLRIAALWLLPLVAGGLLWYLLNGRQQLPVEDISPVSAHAFLTFADGSQIPLADGQKHLLKKDGALVIQDSGCVAYTDNKQTTTEVLFNRLTVPRGGEYVLKLADGSRVWLNSESELRYPVQFSGNNREVFLSGEGYFDVKHDAAKPFVVHTSLGKVEVLGTEFNVRDYAVEQRVVTTLVEGKVKYKSPENQELILTPGFQVTDQTGIGRLKAEKVNLPEFVGWKNGLYVFNNLTLEEMMQTIERNYNVTVFFTNESIKQLRFSGDLKKYDRVEHFLRIIEMGGDISFHVQGKTITVEPKNIR